MNRRKPRIQVFLAFCLWLSGCTASPNFSLSSSSSTVSTTTSTSTSTSSTVGGVKAVKILFQQSTGGSFNAPASGGTPPTPGSGLQAIRLFNTDGTVLASAGASGANWPAWLTSFEIGISGTLNTSSQNPNCAKFADSSESSATNCNFGGGAATAACGAPTNQFRVSEVDCTVGTPAASTGTGSGTDGVYLRATFSRSTSNLGSSENILAVLEYAASALNPAPANPTTCFVGGNFTPESCSDFVWKAYLKHTAAETVQPYLLLIPPTFASVLTAGSPNPQGAGSGVATKQFYIPLAGDSTLTVLQISRVQSAFPSAANLQTYCSPNSILPGNSPLCAGVILYSLTLYRI